MQRAVDLQEKATAFGQVGAVLEQQGPQGAQKIPLQRY